MIIDGHAHAIGDYFSPERLFAKLDSLGVDKVVLAPMGVKQDDSFVRPSPSALFPGCSWRNLVLRGQYQYRIITDAFYDVPNESLYQLKQACPDRVLQFYWANPKDPDILQEINDHYMEWQFDGVKLHQVLSDFDSDSDSMNAIADFCAAHQLPIFIHMNEQRHVEQFVHLLHQHPQTNFIVGHLIGYETLAEQAFHLENYWFDISPCALLPKSRVLKALNHYGSSRLIFGSDHPFGCNAAAKNLQRISELPVPAAGKDQILGGNLQALLGR